jgi:hypothetical protein
MSKLKNIEFPENKHFAFTIIDDTDDAFFENIKPIYDILFKNRLKTTKTVWVYPPRDINESKGDCLYRNEYLNFIKDIHSKGFEIGLHNVGSGDYKRNEIIEGLNEFNLKLGFYPRLHVNHSYNKDNIYSGSKRFSFPFNYLVKKLYKGYDNFSGEDPQSEYFWGDYHKKHIQYTRNFDLSDINTYKILPFMPYKEKNYDEFSNFWFGSTFVPNQWMFNKIVTKKSVDKLENEGGICILYTHLGYYMQKGKIDSGFIRMIEYIGNKKNGWFVPVSNILEFLNQRKIEMNIPEYIPYTFKKAIELHSLITRIKYRYFVKIDDYHFKKSDEYER